MTNRRYFDVALGAASSRVVTVLDKLSVSAAAAYSLRKLRKAYVGSAIRVRRSSDNAEADIGFTSAGDLDETALLAHCGVGDGFVTTWYDQTTNAYDLSQAVTGNQPQIVASGVVNVQNGRPTLSFDGSGDVINSGVGLANVMMANKAFTATHVTFGTNASFGISGNNINGAGALPRFYLLRFSLSYNTLSTVGITSPSGGQTTSYGHDGVTTASAWRNGVLAGTGTQAVVAAFGGTGTLSIPQSPSINAGFMSEFVVVSSSLSTADRQTLENDQMAYYAI
jgi:trimeric autotransporter adhesin